jgi:hypothetical protein
MLISLIFYLISVEMYNHLCSWFWGIIVPYFIVLFNIPIFLAKMYNLKVHFLFLSIRIDKLFDSLLHCRLDIQIVHFLVFLFNYLSLEWMYILKALFIFFSQSFFFTFFVFLKLHCISDQLFNSFHQVMFNIS